LYTTPTPDTERNTPDFQKLTKNSGSDKSEDPNDTNYSVNKAEDSNCTKNSVKIEDPNVTKASIANFAPSESNAAGVKAKKRKTGVTAMVTTNNSEVLIQVVPDKKESQVFAGTKNVLVYETQSKFESDV
jgi:hypothetical protein